jgi:ribonuclease P protein component
MSNEPSVRLRLSRSMRMRQSREFSAARIGGRRLARGCLAINWLSLPGAPGSRLGVITSRRLGNAVIRARARRLMREAYRLHQHELLKPFAIVLVARASIVGKTFQEVEQDFLSLAGRAGLTAKKE